MQYLLSLRPMSLQHSTWYFSCSMVNDLTHSVPSVGVRAKVEGLLYRRQIVYVAATRW